MNIFSTLASFIKNLGNSISLYFGGRTEQWVSKKVKGAAKKIRQWANPSSGDDYSSTIINKLSQLDEYKGLQGVIDKRQSLEAAEKHKIVYTGKKTLTSRLAGIRQETAKELAQMYPQPQKRIFNDSRNLMEGVSIAAAVQDLSDIEVRRAARRFHDDHPELYIGGTQLNSAASTISDASYNPVSAATTESGKEVQSIVNQGLQSQLNSIKQSNVSTAKSIDSALSEFNQSNAQNMNKLLSATLVSNENINSNLRVNFRHGNSVTVRGFEGLNAQALKIGSDLENSIHEGNRRLSENNTKSFQSISDQLYNNEIAAAEAHEKEMNELANSKSTYNQLVDLTSTQMISMKDLSMAMANIDESNQKALSVMQQINHWTDKIKDQIQNEIPDTIGRWLGAGLFAGAVGIKITEALEDEFPDIVGALLYTVKYSANLLTRVISKIPGIDISEPYNLNNPLDLTKSTHAISSSMKKAFDTVCRHVGLPQGLDTMLPGWTSVKPMGGYAIQAVETSLKQIDPGWTGFGSKGTSSLSQKVDDDAFIIDPNSMNNKQKYLVKAKRKWNHPTTWFAKDQVKTNFDLAGDLLNDDKRFRQIFGEATDNQKNVLKGFYGNIKPVIDTGSISVADIVDAVQSVFRGYIQEEKSKNPQKSVDDILSELNRNNLDKQSDLVELVKEKLASHDQNFAKLLENEKTRKQLTGSIFRMVRQYCDNKELFMHLDTLLKSTSDYYSQERGRYSTKAFLDDIGNDDGEARQKSGTAVAEADSAELAGSSETGKSEPDTQKVSGGATRIPSMKPRVKRSEYTLQELSTDELQDKLTKTEARLRKAKRGSVAYNAISSERDVLNNILMSRGISSKPGSSPAPAPQEGHNTTNNIYNISYNIHTQGVPSGGK